ncbi:hypothetical protein NTE_01140 [Candidatus Nitrososphaera evergladensis SR1]|uniref:Uncharacterized protein n=1 Tax=Candidatus Nitrososphaera evergladensis SR1 TaxID=1459636 RepID=A0A075MMK5_9ARCH|nr:hypothetical protein NTE_00288 [Candidatus Nitrososphaera evergladensis SR1]AIF83213.1 hypothetical protein NTE_01140 [Candidatus Nitrososphaera evergladensis SR1]
MNQSSFLAYFSFDLSIFREYFPFELILMFYLESIRDSFWYYSFDARRTLANVMYLAFQCSNYNTYQVYLSYWYIHSPTIIYNRPMYIPICSQEECFIMA